MEKKYMTIQRGDFTKMINSPLVSILLLVYQNFEGLWESLDSVFEQNYNNLELIICDDCSSEFYSYEKKIKDYIEKNRKINIKEFHLEHLKSNVGTTKNCNHAIQISNGKYIKFLSPYDVLYDENVISRCVEYCENNHTEILIGQTFILRKGEGREIRDHIINSIAYRFKARGGRRCTLLPSTRDIWRLKNMSQDASNQLISTWPIISTPSVFFSRALFDRTGGYPENSRLIEDMPFWPALAKNNTKFYYETIIMTAYSLNGISNGGSLNEEFKRDYTTIMREHYIKNEFRGGILNNWLKKVRLKNIDITVGMELSFKEKLCYIDVYLFRLYYNMKYLIIGSRL